MKLLVKKVKIDAQEWSLHHHLSQQETKRQNQFITKETFEEIGVEFHTMQVQVDKEGHRPACVEVESEF